MKVSDIISVTLDVEKKSLNVHYIKEQKNFVWTCEKLELSGDHDQSVLETWWQTIRDALQKQGGTFFYAKRENYRKKCLTYCL